MPCYVILDLIFYPCHLFIYPMHIRHSIDFEYCLNKAWETSVPRCSRVIVNLERHASMTPRKIAKSEKNRNQPLLTRQAAQQPSSPSTLHLACLGRVFRRGLAVGPSSAAPSLRCAPLRPPRLLAPARVSFVACFPSQAPSLRFGLLRVGPATADPISFFLVVCGPCYVGGLCVSARAS